MPRKIISSTPITVAETKKTLEEREQTLNSLQLRTLNYARKVAKLDHQTASRLVKSLTEKFDLKVEEATQVADICPETVDELRVVLSGYRRLVSFLLFSEDKMKSIVQLVQEAVEKSREKQ